MWENKKEWKVKVNKVDKMYHLVFLYMSQCFRVVSWSNPFAGWPNYGDSSKKNWGPILIVYFSLFAMKVFNVRSLNGFATPIHSQLSLKVKSLLSGFVQSNLPHLQMCALLTHSSSKHLLEAWLSEFYRTSAESLLGNSDCLFVGHHIPKKLWV